MRANLFFFFSLFPFLVKNKDHRLVKLSTCVQRLKRKIYKRARATKSIKSPKMTTKSAATTAKGLLLLLNIVANILFRLPVKSLVKFSPACKQWCSSTNDHHFIEQQKRGLETENFLLISTELSCSLEGRAVPVGER